MRKLHNRADNNLSSIAGERVTSILRENSDLPKDPRSFARIDLARYIQRLNYEKSLRNPTRAEPGGSATPLEF